MIIFTNEDTNVSIYSGNVGIMSQEFSGSLSVFMAKGENKRFFEGGSDVELLICVYITNCLHFFTMFLSF